NPSLQARLALLGCSSCPARDGRGILRPRRCSADASPGRSPMDVPTRALFREPYDPTAAALDRPRLSVVLVNYQRWDDTARLVRQLRASEAARLGLAEFVIIDNNSPNHAAVPRLRRTRGVSLLRWRVNRGFARAVNEGCRLARGEWLLLLNP